MTPLVAGLALALALGVAGPGDPAPLRAAVELLEQGRPAEAEQLLRAVLGSSEDALARELLGLALDRQGRPAEAESELRRALAADPTLGSARQQLARVLLRRGDAPGVREVLGPMSPTDLDRDLALWSAEDALQRGDLGAAASRFAALVESTGSVRALMQLARLEVRRGRRDAALTLLERARTAAPSSEDVLTAIAKVSLEVLEPARAVGALEPLARMHPTEAEYPYLLGVARLQLGETESAVSALLHSLELEPGRGLTLIALGLAYNAQKRFGEAKQVLTRVLDLDPGSFEALAALAEAEEGLQDLAAAERHALRALAKVEDHSGALFVLGKIRMGQERYEEARDALRKAVEADPRSPKAHYQLSLAYARLGDRERSAEHLERYREALRAAESEVTGLRNALTAGAGR